MTIELAEGLVMGLAIYAGLGVLVALAIVTVAGRRIDDNFASLKGAPIQARVLVFWGCAGLWPLFALKLLKGEKPA